MSDDQNTTKNQSDPQSQSNDQDDSTYTPSDDNQKHQQSKPPSVTGEEDVFSGDMPQEAADIDEELEKVGKEVDPENPTPLGSGD